MASKKYYVAGGSQVNVTLKDSLCMINEAYETEDEEEQEILDGYVKVGILSTSNKSTMSAAPVAEAVKKK